MRLNLATVLGIGSLAVLAIAYNSKLIPTATNPSQSTMVRRGSGGY